MCRKVRKGLNWYPERTAEIKPQTKIDSESHLQRSVGQKPAWQLVSHQSSVAKALMAWQCPGVGVGDGVGVGGGVGTGEGVGIGVGVELITGKTGAY